jgi:hypothetical protein
MTFGDDPTEAPIFRWGEMRKRLGTWWFTRADGSAAEDGVSDGAAATDAAEVTEATKDRVGGDMNSLDIALKDALEIEGATGAALVDFTSGMTLGKLSTSHTFDLDVAAAGNTEVVRAKLRTMESLGIQDSIEDILITLGRQYHLIRLLTGNSGRGLFLYLVLDKARSNLALARHRLRNIETRLDI